MDPQALADLNSAEFRKAMELFELTNDEFIRTTDPDHIRQVQLFVKKLVDRGDIYLGEFEGWYDRGQEEYITENRARELDYKSPISGKPLEREKQSNYYFRLSAYQDRLEALNNPASYVQKPDGTKCWAASEKVSKTYPSAEPTSRGASRCLEMKSM